MKIALTIIFAIAFGNSLFVIAEEIYQGEFIKDESIQASANGRLAKRNAFGDYVILGYPYQGERVALPSK